MNRVFTVVIISLVASILFCTAAIVFCMYVPTPRTVDGAPLVIESGVTASDLAKKLKREEFISSETVFVWYVRLSGRASYIKAGAYTVPQRANLIDIVSQITNSTVSGLGYGDVHVTLVEGLDSDEVLAVLQKNQLPSDGVDAWQEELTAARQATNELTFSGKPVGSDLSGYLYPDTYFFKKDATAKTIIATLFDNFERHINADRQKAIESSQLSFYEILTLASIVEKEVSSADDRAVVAGIFLQRLYDQYPLQSDATVNFVTHKNTTRPNFSDLETDSLYNTYKHAGLPPGPICNPSFSAIDAVLYPTMTSYYFFLTTLDGRTIFSETYQEHLNATRTYYGN